jgi:prevent-host-death family protein
MEIIPQKQLRNQVGEVLRRVEAGETLLITVAGRPVAELRPAHRHRWVGGPALATVWQGPVPRTLDQDLGNVDATVGDPYA